VSLPSVLPESLNNSPFPALPAKAAT
jgi:hypothetical protein